MCTYICTLQVLWTLYLAHHAVISYRTFKSLNWLYGIKFSFCKRPTTIPGEIPIRAANWLIVALVKYPFLAKALKATSSIKISLANLSASCSSSASVPNGLLIWPIIICATSWKRLNQNLSASFPLTVRPITIFYLLGMLLHARKNPQYEVKRQAQYHILTSSSSVQGRILSALLQSFSEFPAIFLVAILC